MYDSTLNIVSSSIATTAMEREKMTQIMERKHKQLSSLLDR